MSTGKILILTGLVIIALGPWVAASIAAYRGIRPFALVLTFALIGVVVGEAGVILLAIS